MKATTGLSRYLALASCFASLVLSAPAKAQSAGQFVMSGGWAHVLPNASSDNARITGPGINTTSDSTTTVESSDTFAGFVGYYVTDNLGIETFVGIPPRVSEDSSAVANASANPILKTYAWSPMVIAKYVFGSPTSKVRPFIGAGASYIWFTGTSLSQPFKQELSMSLSGGATPNLPSSVTMSRQFAPALIAGVNFNLNAHWMVSGSAVYLPFSATTTIVTSLPGGQQVTTKQKSRYNTVVPTLTVGYRF